MKKIIFLVFTLGCAPWIFGQTQRPFDQVLESPQTVSELFVSCPYLGFWTKEKEEAGRYFYGKRLGWLDMNDEPLADQRTQFLCKNLLLQGLSPRFSAPLTSLVVDEKNGFIRATLKGQNEFYNTVTFVYFEKSDKTKVAAFSLESYEGGPDSTNDVLFFEVKDGAWKPLDKKLFLPKPDDLARVFFPQGAGVFDLDCLSFVSFDFAFPRYGTAVVLTPAVAYRDVEHPTRKMEVAGTSRTVTEGDYDRWFSRVFYDKSQGENRLKKVEWKWNKALSRFELGKKTDALPKVDAPEFSPRTANQVVQSPQNVWEFFLACPALHKKEGSLQFDDSSQSVEVSNRINWLQEKQNYLIGLFDEYERVDQVDVDLANGYMRLFLSEYDSTGGAGAKKLGTQELTLVYFKENDGTPVVAFTLGDSQNNGVDFGNQFYRTFPLFYRVKGPGWIPVEGELIDQKKAAAFPIDPANPQAGGIQKDIVWDLVLPRQGTTVFLRPWASPLQAGSPGVFEAFVKKYYGNQALGLKWDKSKGRFSDPALVPWVSGD